METYTERGYQLLTEKDPAELAEMLTAAEFRIAELEAENKRFRGHARKRPLKRPSKADREEFSQIIDLLYQWAAEQGVQV